MHEVIHVSIDDVVCPLQVRTISGLSDAELDGLARSIVESGGIHQPLLVRRVGEKLILLDGARRLLAARRAGLTTVPVIVEEEPLTEAEVTHRQLVLDAQRVGLTAIERGNAIRSLMQQTGWSATQVAGKIGVSAPSVSRLLALLVLPGAVQQRVAEGRLTMSAAYELAKVRDPAQRERLTAQALSGTITREAIAKSTKSRPGRDVVARPPRVKPERVLIRVREGGLIAVTGHGVDIPKLLVWFEDCVARLRTASTEGRTLADVFKSLASVHAKEVGS